MMLVLVMMMVMMGGVLTRPPNIIVIIADDMGYADLGVFGSPTIRTPCLDKMAQEGIKFTDMYTAQPICTPSRSAFLTSRLPVRNGMYQNVTLNCNVTSHGQSSVLWWNSLGGIPASEVTLPGVLKAHGYTTALVGKWHVGIGRNYEYLPTRKGFEHFYGIPLWHMGPQNQSSVPDVPLMMNETIIGRLYDNIDVNNLTVMYVDVIKKFLSANAQKPFFLYYAPDSTHEPVYSSARFKSSPRGPYGDAVEEMDWSVGQILDQLKSLGIDDNTFVFWSNDNGPAMYLHVERKDVRGWSQAGSAGPLFGGKGTTWEGGMRVPAIARWPGKIAPNRVTGEVASLMDVFPTVLDFLNISVPRGLVLDGRSMSDFIFKDGEGKHEFLYMWRGDTLYAVRHGDYKAHFWTQGGDMYTTPPTKQHSPPLLFNIMRDPGEAFPLTQELDPNYKNEIAAITAAAKQHVASFVPPSPEFNLCDNNAGMWKPDLPNPYPTSRVFCCVGGGN